MLRQSAAFSAWPDYFHQLAQRDRYLFVEKKFYARGRPKLDLITIKEADGRDLIVSNDSGYRSSRLEVPAEIFTYFVQKGIVDQEGPEDHEHRSVFRLTPDGFRVAHQLSVGEE
jgi:hypothetical protein